MYRKTMLVLLCVSLSGCVLYDREVEKMTETHRKAIAAARADEAPAPASTEESE